MSVPRENTDAEEEDVLEHLHHRTQECAVVDGTRVLAQPGQHDEHEEVGGPITDEDARERGDVPLEGDQAHQWDDKV